MAIFRKFGRSESGLVLPNLAFGLIYEAKSQVDQYETGIDLQIFSKIAMDINGLEIHFGCAFSISDTLRTIF